jgi:hypothetical protein
VSLATCRELSLAGDRVPARPSGAQVNPCSARSASHLAQGQIDIGSGRYRALPMGFRPSIRPPGQSDGDDAAGTAIRNIAISSDVSSWARRVSNLRPLACEAGAPETENPPLSRQITTFPPACPAPQIAGYRR